MAAEGERKLLHVPLMLVMLTRFRRCAGSHRTRGFIYFNEDDDDDEDDDTCNVTSCTCIGLRCRRCSGSRIVVLCMQADMYINHLLYNTIPFL